MGFFNYVRFMGGITTILRLKFEPKVLETWNFARSIPFISSFQKYLNAMLCQQIFCWRQHFLFKILQHFIKIGPISNCYIQATNKGQNDIYPSLESSNIGLHIYNNFFTTWSNFSADVSNFWTASCNTFMTTS